MSTEPTQEKPVRLTYVCKACGHELHRRPPEPGASHRPCIECGSKDLEQSVRPRGRPTVLDRRQEFACRPLASSVATLGPTRARAIAAAAIDAAASVEPPKDEVTP